MTKKSNPEIVRCFWHGAPLGPYQLLCLRSFHKAGHLIELYTYDKELMTPRWIEVRDAGSIWPTSGILTYQSGFGRGSPALHSNLFRYALLDRTGGWWIDLDILLLQPTLPTADFFFSRSGYGDEIFTGILKFPKGHPLLAEAVNRCLDVGERAYWGQTGAELLTELVSKHGLRDFIESERLALPVQWYDLPDLFDPQKRDIVVERCSGSLCIHLFNEAWRGSGIPNNLAPPRGSFLDRAFSAEYPEKRQFTGVMTFDHVRRWIINRKSSIQREFEAVQLNRQLEELHEDNLRLNLQNLDLRDQVAALMDSTSWRITAPLRAIRRLLSRKSGT